MRSHPEETREVRGGQPDLFWHGDFVDVGAHPCTSQAEYDPELSVAFVGGIEHCRLGGFILPDHAIEAKAQTGFISCWISGAETGSSTSDNRSQRPSIAVWRRRRDGRHEGANPPGGAGAFETRKIRTQRPVAKRDSVIWPAWNWQDFPG